MHFLYYTFKIISLRFVTLSSEISNLADKKVVFNLSHSFSVILDRSRTFRTTLIIFDSIYSPSSVLTVRISLDGVPFIIN